MIYKKDLGVKSERELVGPRPINPFVSVDAEQVKEKDVLSPIQKKIVKFVEEEARDASRKVSGVQPPPIKLFGEEAEEERKKHRKTEQEFFERYNISKEMHDQLIELIFYGRTQVTFSAMGHSFLMKDLDSETRRYITEYGRRVWSPKALEHLKIKAISHSLKELDGVALDASFLEKFLWSMQSRMVSLLHRMHLLTEQHKIVLFENLPNFCRTPTSRIRYAVCKDIGITINDPLFRKLSEDQVYWHYINSAKHAELDAEAIHNRIEYLSYFINPEMAKKVAENKEMKKNSELNLIQQYSFLNGISELIKGDMAPGAVEETMDILMSKVKPGQEAEAKDPWQEPEKQSWGPEGEAFIRGLKQQENKPADEGLVGMAGGDKSWYSK